jgi:hypothetical protein
MLLCLSADRWQPLSQNIGQRTGQDMPFSMVTIRRNLCYKDLFAMNHTKDMRIIPSFYPLFHKEGRGEICLVGREVT